MPLRLGADPGLGPRLDAFDDIDGSETRLPSLLNAAGKVPKRRPHSCLRAAGETGHPLPQIAPPQRRTAGGKGTLGLTAWDARHSGIFAMANFVPSL